MSATNVALVDLLQIVQKGQLDARTDSMLKMRGVFAEMECNMISEHVKSGMANAVAKEGVVGRVSITINSLSNGFIKYYSKHRSEQINKTELTRLCDVSRQLIYKCSGTYER